MVNITKFGAFVNILPGRDGLVHISKLGRGRRVEKVEDVVDLGDEVEVRVDDIDPQGKVSLSLAGDGDGNGAGNASDGRTANRRAETVTTGEADGPASCRSRTAGKRRRRPPSATSARPTPPPGRVEAGDDADTGPRRNPRRRRS